MLFLVQNGFRVVAAHRPAMVGRVRPLRERHGRLCRRLGRRDRALDLKGRHAGGPLHRRRRRWARGRPPGTKRVAKAVLVAAVRRSAEVGDQSEGLSMECSTRCGTGSRGIGHSSTGLAKRSTAPTGRVPSLQGTLDSSGSGGIRPVSRRYESIKAFLRDRFHREPREDRRPATPGLGTGRTTRSFP